MLRVSDLTISIGRRPMACRYRFVAFPSRFARARYSGWSGNPGAAKA